MTGAPPLQAAGAGVCVAACPLAAPPLASEEMALETLSAASLTLAPRPESAPLTSAPLGGAEERLKDGVGRLEVVVHHVHEEVVVKHGLEELARGRRRLVHLGPVASDLVRLVLPRQERDRLDDRRLDDLAMREDAPGDGVGRLRVGVGAHVALRVDGVVGDLHVGLDASDERIQILGRHKELEVRLLVDVAVLGAPAVHLVVAASAVDGRLRVDGEEAELVHLGELFADHRRLACDRCLGPGERLDLAGAESLEERLDVVERLGRAPHLLGLVVRVAQLDNRLCAVDVALRAVGPEDGADLFVTPLGRETGSPGERADLVDGRREAEVVKEHARALFEVHGVDVQAADAEARADDLLAHVADEASADLSHLLVVVLDRVEGVVEVLGHERAEASGGALESAVGLDGHDAGDDGAGDAGGPDVLDPLCEDVKVVEHLGEDEVGACVDLGLEALELLFGAVDCLGMALGEACDGDGKVVSVLLADVLDELLGLGEAGGVRLPLGLSGGRVTTEGEDVAAAELLGLLEGGVDLVARHVGAGEVHARLEADVGVDGLYERSGEVGGATACVPGDVDELGAEIGHALDTVIEVGEALGGAGREVLEAPPDAAFLFGLCDLVGDLPGGVALGRKRRGVDAVGHGEWR
ncbi:hypothetical protein L1887_51939 [Cichorium endivia]|nr:hypothetical protein L1887_51939 [Cichorium endivia]